MPLEQIGFYTLSDKRAKQTSGHSPMWRCELILTNQCNFKCPYCRGLEVLSRDCTKDINIDVAFQVLDNWIADGLKNIRFSGGEPTLYPCSQHTRWFFRWHLDDKGGNYVASVPPAEDENITVYFG